MKGILWNAMKLLIADESSLAWDTKIGFFMYGGIVVDETEAKPLAEGILNIKVKYGLPKIRPIKWNNERWEGSTLDGDTHRNVKDEVLTLFSESGAKLIVCLSPHQFYHSRTIKEDGKIKMTLDPKTQIRSHKYGINDLLYQFDQYLGRENYGIVMADRFGDAVKSDMDLHCIDLFPNGGTRDTSRYILKKIALPIIQVENEDSYLHQINDVVLGAIFVSFREMGHNFLPQIKNNFWAVDRGVGMKITGSGFNIYPIRTSQEWCRTAKNNLQAKFNRLISQV